MISSIIFILSGTCVALSMTTHYFLGANRLKLTYISSITTGVVAIVLNTTLFLTNPDNAGVLMFHATSVWQIINSSRGLWKLNDSEK